MYFKPGQKEYYLRILSLRVNVQSILSASTFRLFYQNGFNSKYRVLYSPES